MGYEYRVKFTYDNVAQVDGSLRALPNFDSYDEARVTYIYRTPENMGVMPDAEINIETDGLYLCHFGTPLIGVFEEQLNSHFQNVQLEEL